jgi:hypothetical protein
MLTPAKGRKMTDELAEQVESGITFDEEVDNAISNDATEESAPQEDESPAAEMPEEIASEAEGQLSERAQKRFNKVTFDKHEQARRADTAEAKIVELEAKIASNVPPLREPKLEDPDIDFDEDKLIQAKIDYKVDLAISKKSKGDDKLRQESQAEQNREDISKKFLANCEVFAKDKKDFNEVLQSVPPLQPAVLDELMVSEQSAALAYFLGNHQELANKIVKMNPVRAGVELGKIAARLAEPKQIKPSDAPDPIDPLKGGGKTTTERGPKGATFE